ncbi:MAG TPA: hypothetical protein VJ596_10870 [Gemmatimonadaceae bacterium]|nr:hypothetical protein [Gemmatimonadaceae bacterium]
MPKTDIEFDPAEYAPVADRIALFYERFPEGRIITELVSRSAGEITFRALVYRTSEPARPAATGWASEREGDGEINAVACLENAETSAIGRALANLGFTAARQRPSREEMAKAQRARQRSQALGMAASDAMTLLATAERRGLSERRAAIMRASLTRSDAPIATIVRIERLLRRWLADTRMNQMRMSNPGDNGMRRDSIRAV